MKKICMLLAMSLVAVSGCAQNSSNGTGPRSDVFKEVSDTAKVPQGAADLRVYASLKTHKAGAFAAPDVHGTADYRMLLNVDGQELELHRVLEEENREPVKLRDPEAGEGIRYLFSRTLRLKEGPHKVTVSLPDDQVVVQRELVLKGGEVNDLVLEPVYGAEPGMRRSDPYTATSYKTGIRSFRMILNGREIRSAAE